MEEIWKEIPGFNGLYLASNFGKINNSNGFILSPIKKSNGYMVVNFTFPKTGTWGKRGLVHQIGSTPISSTKQRKTFAVKDYLNRCFKAATLTNKSLNARGYFVVNVR